jgi:hypothetical protein
MKLLTGLFKGLFKLKTDKRPTSLLAEHINLVTNGGWIERMETNKRLDYYKIQNQNI